MDLNKVNTPYYNDYGTWIRRQFPYRVQKISIDAGFTCPNRDGRISTGGCIYCDNRTFNPSYCQRRHSVTEQLEEGKRFFAHKYPDMKTKWEPQFVDFTFGNNVSELDTHPTMVGLEYQGKHVKGYISYHMLYGFKLLYKTDEMPCAKAFVKPEEKFSEKRRKTLLETFNMYPEMEAYIKGLTKKEFKEDRLCILRKLDDILSASNAHK